MSKEKRLGKVAKELLKDPTLTTREVAEKTGVSKSTVANYINGDLDNVGQKDDRIVGICDDDLKVILETQKEILKRIANKPEEVTMSDLIRASDSSTKRYTIFGDKGDDQKREFIISF